MTTTRLPEFTAKLDRVRRWLEAEGRDAVELTRYSWLSWLLCGAEARVLAAAERGSCAVRITRDRVVVVTNNIEAPRLHEEEGLASLPVDWEIHNWWLPPLPSNVAEDLPPRLRLGTGCQDLPVAGLRENRLHPRHAEGAGGKAQDCSRRKAVDLADRGLRP